MSRCTSGRCRSPPGCAFPFTDPGEPTEDLAPRHFTSFDQAAQEAGMSRIYGGIPCLSDHVYGLQVGGAVGQYVVQHELLPPARTWG